MIPGCIRHPSVKKTGGSDTFQLSEPQTNAYFSMSGWNCPDSAFPTNEMCISYQYLCLSYLSERLDPHKLLKGTGDVSVRKFQVDACCILLISPQHSLLLQDTHSLILLPVTSYWSCRDMSIDSGSILSQRCQWIISCYRSAKTLRWSLSVDKMAKEMLRVLDLSRLPSHWGSFLGKV